MSDRPSAAEPRTEAGIRECVTLDPPYPAYWRQVLTDVIYDAIHNPPGGPKNVPSGQIAEAVVKRLQQAAAATPSLDVPLRYGRHDTTCPDYDNDPPWDSCSCGWSDALARLDKGSRYPIAAEYARLAEQSERSDAG